MLALLAVSIQVMYNANNANSVNSKYIGNVMLAVLALLGSVNNNASSVNRLEQRIW